LKILLVEDDRETSDVLAQGLRDEGHGVDVAADGRRGLDLAAAEWDLLIVDRMLPGLDGLTLVQKMRGRGDRTPVLFLSTMSGVDDRVTGLQAGGDDYLVKPFVFAELVARVNALGRRRFSAERQSRLVVADLELDLIARRVVRAGSEIDLQPREFRLLEYLMRNPGQVVTRSMLLEKVWDFHFDPHTNVVETQISRLRTKVDKGHPVALIQTIRSVGYCLRAPG